MKVIKKSLKEDDIIMQNMVKLLMRNPNGGSQFAQAVLDVLPNDKEFMSQFINTMQRNLIG